MMSAEPLRGRRILVTRRPEQSSALVTQLREMGATVLEVPLIEVAPPENLAPLTGALDSLEAYDWVVFTSANAVRALAECLHPMGEVRIFPRVASVGPATSEAIRELLPAAAVARMPATDHRAEGLLAAFSDDEVRGRHF